MGRNDSRRGRNRNWNNNHGRSEQSSGNHNQQQGRAQNGKKGHGSSGRGGEARRPVFVNTVTQKDIQENAEAIRAFKANVVTCEICGEAIPDVSTAMANRGSGNPVHFDCIISKIAETETLGENEKITYIGQGRFGVVHFDNVHDLRHFQIKKIIEWESRESERASWRETMAGLYSQTK